MYAYRKYESADEAMKDMAEMDSRGWGTVTAWFNSVDKLVYVTYKMTADSDQIYGR